jgi:hypothetical protein
VPRTDAERTIARIWRELLRLAAVGVHDNFFELGGHSLLVSKVRVRLAEALGRDVPMVAFYTYPTIAALAGHLAAPDADTGAGARTGTDREVDGWRAARARVEQRRRLLQEEETGR